MGVKLLNMSSNFRDKIKRKLNFEPTTIAGNG